MEEEPREAIFFWLHLTLNHYESMFLGASHCESMFLGASPVKLFHFTPFGRKRLQTASEAGGEADRYAELFKRFINIVRP